MELIWLETGCTTIGVSRVSVAGAAGAAGLAGVAGASTTGLGVTGSLALGGTVTAGCCGTPGSS